ncbi:alpha/beta hydrolase family protein [Niveispirillum sp. KHB5.9]|uniref:alpha/beta hydrolase family protein n=1 Tax=Niveispirillum sp. KHB5.9 TaxID=3400269 RepID=UPI003A89C444
MATLSRRSLLLSMAATAALPALAQVLPPRPADLTVKTPAGRAVAVNVWKASGKEKGRILFSHGAASAPWKYQPLVDAWTKAGYSVYAPLHVDSADHPDRAAFQGLASWPARIEDMRALADHIDGPYIAAGHSYGGLVALCLGGSAIAVPPSVKTPLRDPRAKAVLAFSPPGAGMGFINPGDYAPLAVPALIQTGDKDIPPGPGGDWKSHLLPYDEAAPGGERYALVLDGVDHYFGGGICRPELPGPVQAEQLSIAADLSVLFMRAHAGGDKAALASLKGRLSEAGPARLTLK